MKKAASNVGVCSQQEWDSVTLSLKALSSGKDYPIDLTVGDGQIVMANTDDKGEAEINAR